MIGDARRPVVTIQFEMASVSRSRSPSTDHARARLSLLSGLTRPRPVPGGSRKTRSVKASQDCGFASRSRICEGAPFNAIRHGPTAPRLRKADEVPGPPPITNVTGRADLSVPPLSGADGLCLSWGLSWGLSCDFSSDLLCGSATNEMIPTSPCPASIRTRMRDTELRKRNGLPPMSS